MIVNPKNIRRYSSVFTNEKLVYKNSDSWKYYSPSLEKVVNIQELPDDELFQWYQLQKEEDYCTKDLENEIQNRHYNFQPIK